MERDVCIVRLLAIWNGKEGRRGDACQTFLDEVTEVTESVLLSRPLRMEGGGTAHGGGDQFYDRADPSYVLLACWLTGRRYEGLECQL